MHLNLQDFLQFIIQAKKNTYASQGDEASVVPVLNGSKQLEYRLGDYFYRDIYFGMEFFIGQEIIEYREVPVWSMVYSGGMIQLDISSEQTGQIYKFLRNALKSVNDELPYRGPELYEERDLLYRNKVNGDIGNFSGYEAIYSNNRKLYELNYNGGFIR